MNTIAEHLISPADADLSRRIRLFLEQRRLLGGSRLTIAADRGVVTIEGSVPTFHQRQLIVSATRRVAGAVQIVDELEVDPPRVAASRQRSSEKSVAALATTLALLAGMLAAPVNCSWAKTQLVCPDRKCRACSPAAASR